ncbi:DUF2288 domain-containing protein [Agaribacterium sp. ZY112]|uniref:DUF2288 domain-containing protein n=1 Tax=Agaribacterium sp. ZY112 TaxID=3233574 RepID=UPI0035242390
MTDKESNKTNSSALSEPLNEQIQQELNRECAKIPWSELQRFFASGIAVSVAKELDLIEVAQFIHADDAARINAYMESGLIAQVSDEQAQQWIRDDASVWALVIKPWVLVQAA